MADKAQIGIIGAGLMGHGLAQVFLVAGHKVAITDPFPDTLKTAPDRIRRNLTELGQDPSVVDNLRLEPTLEGAVKDADVVFEAAPEKPALKQSIFVDLEKYAPRHALLSSNTSVIPINLITEKVEKTRDRVLGTHWWNPPFLVPLVEVVGADGTAPETITKMLDLLKSAGKVPVHVKKDVPGFVGNRLQHALWREAVAIVQEGIADAETVDTVVKASFGRRLPVIGPLENADLVGTDLTLDIHENVLPHIDRTPGPLPYLKDLVASGKLGFKTGEGFRKWTPEQQAELRRKVAAHLRKMDELGY